MSFSWFEHETDEKLVYVSINNFTFITTIKSKDNLIKIIKENGEIKNVKILEKCKSIYRHDLVYTFLDLHFESSEHIIFEGLINIIPD